MKTFGFVSTFVAPVPKKNLKAYKKFAKQFGKVWKKHGAIDYFECIGDKLDLGTVTSYPKSVKLKKGEVVVVGWALFRNKAQHDRAMKKFMTDPDLEAFGNPDDWPFDGMRMYWGGFKPIVTL